MTTSCVSEHEYKVSSNERYFQNPFKSWIQIRKAQSNETCEADKKSDIEIVLSAIDDESLSQRLISYIVSFVQHILKNYNPETVEEYEYRGSIYVGIGGFCILFLRIIELMDVYQSNTAAEAKNNNNNNDDDEAEFSKSFTYDAMQWKMFMEALCDVCHTQTVSQLQTFLLRCVFKFNNAMLNDFESRPSQKQRYSFLEGIAGAYGIRIVYYYYTNNEVKLQKYLQKLQSLAPCVQQMKDVNELLYGRMGYVSTYLFVYRFLRHHHSHAYAALLNTKSVIGICESVIDAGTQFVATQNAISSDNNFLATHHVPIMWEWHQSQYLGGAHGVAGILNTLISIDSIRNKHQKLFTQMLRCCYHSFRFKSGNYASSVRGYLQQRDSLVQFCHGSTGFVPLFLNAYTQCKTHNEEYLEFAIDAQRVVWSRGILTKGPGLCHGVGGNGYVFLRLFQVTKDRMFLYRALRFAQVLLDDPMHFHKKPDRKDSLFEGKCGGVMFTLDTMFAAQSAKFPCYEF